jgi:polygalacturonase
MKNGVTLRLMSGATLLGSPHLKDYPEMEPGIRSYTDNYVCRSLIYGENLHDIGIVGDGAIDGNGHGPEFQEEGYKNRTRPYLIRIINCENVTIRDVFLTRSPMWLQHYLACRNIRMSGVRVFNHGNRNNDSVDIDGCSDVVISGCIFDSDDDGITLKSTSPHVTENVVISDCVVGSHCNPIKMGTESTGGFRNVTISNCVIRPSTNTDVVYGRAEGLAGLALEIVDGGVMEHIAISNISMETIGTPIFIRLGNRARKHAPDAPEPGVGALRHVTISNVTAHTKGVFSSSITGIPGHPVDNIKLSNIRIVSDGGGSLQNIPNEVPEAENKYPESTMFGALSSSGLYIRHAENISLDNFHFSSTDPDPRMVVVSDDVSGLTFSGLRADARGSGQAVVRLIGCRDVMVAGAKAPEETRVFLSVDGAASKNITLTGNDLSKAGKAVETGEDVPAGAVTDIR